MKTTFIIIKGGVEKQLIDQHDQLLSCTISHINIGTASQLIDVLVVAYI
jgi:hypothetical protein